MCSPKLRPVRDVDIDLKGFHIRGLHWQGEAELPTLALHGWLDNAASFQPLANLLPQLDLWAIDMPGHGLTDHRPAPGNYNIWDDLLDILALADSQGWEQFNVLAHSRGALIANLLCATMPERVGRAVFLDGIWPMAVDQDDAPSLLRQYLLDRRGAKTERFPHFESLEVAVAARAKAAAFSETAARLIVERGVEALPDGRVRWRNDPHLMLASAFKLTEAHIDAFLAAQSVPIKLLLASEGFARFPGVEEILSRHPHIQWQQLEGGHHMHMEQPEVMAPLVSEFLMSDSPTG